MTVKPSVHCCVDPLFPLLLDVLYPRRLMTNARKLLCVLTVEQLMVQMGEREGVGGERGEKEEGEEESYVERKKESEVKGREGEDGRGERD